VKTLVYDGGMLIAIDKCQFVALRRHQDWVRQGHRIMVPAPVAAQAVRDPRRQVRLVRLLSGCDLVPFQRGDVWPVGTLLAKAGTSDVVDGFVAVAAARVGAAVVTSDGDDIRHLLETLSVRLPVLAP